MNVLAKMFPENVVPPAVKRQIAKKANRIFLRRLYRLPYGCSKADRVKALHTGSQKQRMLLIHVLHQVALGEIPIRRQDKHVVTQSGKSNYLDSHFQDPDDVKNLLAMTDAEQKSVLAHVNNYHVLLFQIFNL